MYLMFPIGWMYYFGTNLDERFGVPEFWPKQEQSHKLPYDKEDLKQEVQRIQREMRDREMEMMRRTEVDGALAQAKAFRRGGGEEGAAG